MSEYFRRNAGIVVFRADKKVLLCQRNDMADSWQFPQGGIEDGETLKKNTYTQYPRPLSFSAGCYRLYEKKRI